MCHNVINATKDEILLELRPDVKVTVIKNSVWHSETSRCIPTQNLGFLPQIIEDTIFLERGPGVKFKITVTKKKKEYATLRDPKVYPHTKHAIPTSNDIGYMFWARFSRIEARGQGHSDSKIVCNTPRLQGVASHQIWDSHLK